VAYDYDFAVAGGGPGGSSAAIALAQRGHSVVMFERETFPRFHIGESLLSTANDAFAALGLADRIDDQSFAEKWGALLISHDGAVKRRIDFAGVTEVRRPQTWQVWRALFDRILLDRAREVGVDVRQRHRVNSCEFTPDAAIVEFAGDGAPPDRVRVRAIVDATGRHGLIARKFNLRNAEPRLANVAIFSHYSGVPRIDDVRPDDIRIISRDDAGWFWLIPLSRDVMSVGVVVPKDLLLQMPGESNEERLEQAINGTPAVAELMRNAFREAAVRVEKDFSYRASAYAGDRWILVGDAGSFLDPVFSTGVSIAMESGIEAAAELDRALKRDAFHARTFAAFSRRQRRRYETFRRFVIAFYSPQFRDLFFTPKLPKPLFRAMATVLSGRWNASLRTRLLNHLFFALVAVQKHVRFSTPHFRRDASAGYP